MKVVGGAFAARSSRGFIATGRSGRGKGSSALLLLWRGVGAMRRRPVVAAGALLASLSAGAVGWNALAVQTKRHPAPLFSPRTGVPTLRPEAAPALPPRPSASASPPAVPAPPPAKTPPREVPVETARSAAPAPAVPPAPARPASSRDPIGDVIRGELDGSAPKPEGARNVAAAQRALLKLGYGAVKPDGVAGPATRQAIERFERERRLPVTGELGPRTVRELAAQSGVSIE
jgi:hypothetical protein